MNDRVPEWGALQRDAFLRFFWIKDVEGATFEREAYNRLEDTGLKRLLTDFFPPLEEVVKVRRERTHQKPEQGLQAQGSSHSFLGQRVQVSILGYALTRDDEPIHDRRSGLTCPHRTLRLRLLVKTDIDTCDETGQFLSQKGQAPIWIEAARVPCPDENGVFLVKGQERVPVGHIARSPGVSVESERTGWCATLRPDEGAHLKFHLRQAGRRGWEIVLETGRQRRQLDGAWIKRLCEAADTDAWPKWEVALEDSLQGLGRRVRSAFDPTLSGTYDLSPGGRRRLNEILGLNELETRRLTPGDALATLRSLLHAGGVDREDVRDGPLEGIFDRAEKAGYTPCIAPGAVYDPYDLGQKRVLMIGDLLARAFRSGLRDIQRRLRLLIPERGGDIRWGGEVFIRDAQGRTPLDREVERVFLRHPLVQAHDRLNPLSDLSHRRKVTYYPPDSRGNNRLPRALRDIHESARGRVCPLETPQGPPIGLNLYLASDARIDPEGRIVKGKEMLGLSASLIPFLQHDDGTRGMMAANMMKQTLPLVHPEPPLVQTGLEEQVARTSGWGIYAEAEGIVTEATEERVVVGGRVYSLTRWQERNPYHVNFHHTPTVLAGDRVKAGQVLADGPAMKEGSLALGRNLLVAVMPWKGYNFEDALVVSQEVVGRDLLTSEHLHIRREALYGDERLTRDVVEISEEERARLDDRGIVRVGVTVGPGDILIAVERKKEANQKEARFRRTDADERGEVVDVHVAVRAEAPVGTLKERARIVCAEVTIKILRRRPLTVGDKLANRHGNKGVVAAIVPPDQMPRLPGGRPVDLIMNPLGVISRMNVGQLLEAHWGAVIRHRGEPSRIFPPFQPCDEAQLLEALKSAQIEGDAFLEGGKIYLQDGTGGPTFDHPVVVGWMYWMKLSHMSEDKIHARSTGRYVQGTQQPPQGRRAGGGQRLGEMEVWALEAHGASVTLQEMLTAKSDEVEGRRLLNRHLLKGVPFKKETYIPQSFRAFVSLMRSVSLNMEALDGEGEPLDLFGPKSIPVEAIRAVRIRPATSADIRRWSKGEVGNREGIAQYEDLFKRPFGDEVGFLCACGRVREQKNEGQRCQACGEEVRYRRRRADEGGYISLAAPIVNPSFSAEVEQLMEIASWRPEDAGTRGINGRVDQEAQPSEKEFRGTGEEARRYIETLDVDQRLEELHRAICAEPQGPQRNRYRAWHRLLRDLKQSGARPSEALLLTCLPILPLSLRPRPEDLDGTARGHGHPLNKHYRAVIRFNNLVLKCQERGVQSLAEAFVHDLARSVERLFEAIWQMVEGKEGFLRHHLLGKRADFSGRIVVVPDPERLRMDQCGIPLRFAAGLFEPYLIRHLSLEKVIPSPMGGRAFIQEALKTAGGRQRIRKLVEEIIQDRVLLLNRFPTLHRMNLQGFHPVLLDHLEGEGADDAFVMTIHPLVCAGYNADFDGDQFSIHLPISPAAQSEAERRMLSTTQIVSPANGSLSPVNLAQDIVIGIFYLTAYAREEAATEETSALLRRYRAGETGIFDVLVGAMCKDRDYHAWVEEKDGRTTVGRAMLSELFGETICEPVDKRGLRRRVEAYRRRRGDRDTIDLLEKLMCLGFRIATQAGVSLGFFDLPGLDPEEKRRLLEEAEQKAEEIRAFFPDEKNEENRKGVIGAWQKALEAAGDSLVGQLPKEYHPVAVMVRSSARGDKESLAQMGAFRGLMGRPGGGYIRPPIDACFREGLSRDQFFTSSYGFRKGGVGKALSTSDAGYLTRKLVDCCHWIRVVDLDCGDQEGILLRPILKEDGSDMLSLKDRLWGRRLAVDLTTPDGSVIKRAGDFIVQDDLTSMTGQIRVRSPLSCHCREGICAICYGNDLSSGELVEVGYAAGVIAGQSLGEPTTQIALRSFHMGGVARLDLVDALQQVVSFLEIQKETPARLKEIESRQRERLEGMPDGEEMKGLLREIEDKRASQQYLADELQRIYRLSRQDVNDIHFEVVVRGMFRDMEIRDGEEAGEVISLEQAERRGIPPERLERVPQGIRASAQCREGFLSAASFEQTRKTLCQAALRGEIDLLSGLKERVILGQAIR